MLRTSANKQIYVSSDKIKPLIVMLHNHVSSLSLPPPSFMGTMNFYVHVILFISFAAVTFAAFANHLKQYQREDQLRITGGHDAVPNSHPYIVSLQLRFLWVRVHLCGGTILNEYWVLTAGHCVMESWLMRWLAMDVVAGAHDVNKFGPQVQISTVARRIVHPLYNGGIGPNDIALLKVKSPLVFTKQVQPVKLPVDYKISPQPMTLSGWGVLKTTIFFPALPGQLQEVQVTYVPYNECYEALEYIKDEGEENPLDKDANVCTGPLTGGIAACNGDSGGPLVQVPSVKTVDNTQEGEKNNEDYDYLAKNTNELRQDVTENEDTQSPVIIGVVSWGAQPCGERGAPTVYTKVSHYLDFINQYIDK